MSRAEVRIESKGVRALLQSSAVQADVLKRAERIAETANAGLSADGFRAPGFAAFEAAGKDRAGAIAVTVNEHAKRSQNKKNTLLKAIDAGR